MAALDHVALCDGLQFPESPVALGDGAIAVCEIAAGRISHVAPDGAKRTLVQTGGNPSGLAIGPDGYGYVCNGGGSGPHRGLNRVNMPRPVWEEWKGGSIQRVHLETGKCETLYDGFDGGKKLQSPNDLVFDARGGFWFTDHGRDNELGRNYGGIFYARADGSKITRMELSFVSPNGIGLAPDGKTLYMADSFLGRLWAFDVVGPGELAPSPPTMPARVVQTLPGYQILDSLKLEQGGKICVGTIINGGITAFDEDGTTEHFALPDVMCTNLCFGGADMRDVWIAASTTGRLLKARWPRPGLRLHFNPY